MIIADRDLFHEWLAKQRDRGGYSVDVVPLSDLDGWTADPVTGNLRHRTGRFFTVEGVRVETDHAAPGTWTQPIIDQPESGLLGVLAMLHGGKAHFLLQAKMEPGNFGTVQVSPTVQATRSNYSRVHQGRAVPYLEWFFPPRGRVLTDALQTEQGTWVLRKRNRNMIVWVDSAVPVEEGFCWVPEDLVAELLRENDVINMDARSVLAGWPEPGGAPAEPGGPGSVDLLSWLTDRRTHHRLDVTRIPLAAVEDWTTDGDSIRPVSGNRFSVVGVDVRAGTREVARWSQPLLAPSGQGIAAFLVRRTASGTRVLVRAHTEAGTRDVVELGPTVQYTPSAHRDAPDPAEEALIQRVLSATADRVLYDVVHSEEGGRFHHARNRYLLVEEDEDRPAGTGVDHRWVDAGLLARMVPLGGQVNVEARTLLAALRFGPGLGL
ncbi:NDP-hexose 2,3-dehydratase family protein [Nocardiopsis dassonvillei]|uniref:NDP-hexose 2,3-dehydratase family protein n=1 Tax=Nocardiopsis dassonvillei TaxID=2014 RepID=UPI00366BA323